MADVRMPDGTIIRNVTEGTTKAQLQARFEKQAALEKFKAYDAQALITNKMTMGLSDKAVPAAEAAIQYAKNLFGPSGKRKAYGDLYQREQADRDQRREQYQAANPATDWLTLPFNLMGGGPAKLAAAPLTARQLAGVGGQVGLVAGAGNSRGSVKDQISQTMASGVVGAGTAPIIAPVASWAAGKTGKLVSSLRTPKPAPVANTGTNALRIASKALTDQGMTPAQAGKMIQEANRRGVPLALMDTGDETRGLVSALARKPGPNRTLVRDVVIPRQEAQLERVQGALSRDLGPTVGIATESERLSKSAMDAARPLYEKAYASPLPDDEILGNIVKLDTMQKALNGGRQIHAEETALALAKGEVPPPPLPENGVDVRTLDFAKRALQKQIDGAYSGDSAAKMQLDNLKGTRNALLERLDKVVPAYAEARAAYRGPNEMRDALELGKSLVTKSADDIEAAVGKLSPAELEQVRLGYRSSLSDMTAGRADAADKVKAIVGTPKKRAALQKLFGDQDGIDNFLATLANEKAASETFGRVATGSQTSANDADLLNLNESLGGAALNTVGRAVTGQGVISNGLMTVRDLARYGLGKQGERVRTELSALLTETRPEVLAEILRGASKREARDRLLKLAAANAAKKGRAVGSIFGGQLPARGITSIATPEGQ